MKHSNVHQKKYVGVKWKLFLFLAAFAALILLVLWLCQVVFLEDIYRFIKTTEIKNAAYEISETADDIGKMSETAQKVASSGEICTLAVRMVGPNKAVHLLSYDEVKECVIHNMTQEGIFTLYDEAVKNGGSVIQHFKYDLKLRKYISVESGNVKGSSESIIYSLIVKDISGNSIFIILNSVISPVVATVKTLNSLLIIISLLMMILALIFAAIISKRISKPITEISEAAKLLAAGNYGVNFVGGSYREINDLAVTLNYAESELSKVEGLRRELIANTSHDLRTPLTMITGYAEVMRDLPGENTPDNAQIIIDESKRLTSLVNDMLDISKLESGNISVAWEILDITDLLSEGMERYSQFREKEGYKIDFLFKRHVNVKTDRSKFLQAFYNIVNNAVTYTGPDKSVTVRQDIYIDPSDNKEWVRASVTDTGDGISQDKPALIWDRYYKVDAEHKRAAQGTGLGLSIVNKLMFYLHGRCGVVSTVGKGSTFWIEIPTLDQSELQ